MFPVHPPLPHPIVYTQPSLRVPSIRQPNLVCAAESSGFSLIGFLGMVCLRVVLAPPEAPVDAFGA